MIRLHYIYGLFDPRDNKLRYVGLSVNPSRRYREHTNISKIEKGSGYSRNWILSLLNVKMKPFMKIIEVCDDLDVGIKREVYWIRFFKKKNCDLTNVSLGGNGIKGVVVSESDRDRISKSLKLYYKNNPIEDKLMRERFRVNCHKGRPLTNEQKENLKTMNSVPIKCNETGIVYESLNVAAKKLGVQSPNICKVLKGIRKTTGGYTFAYIKDGGCL